MTTDTQPAPATPEAFPSQEPPAAARRRKLPGTLEALVALGILVSLSGVLMPVIGEEVGEARRLQAYADMDAIATGLSRYQADTRFLPTGIQGRTDVSWLYGPGTIPANNPLAGSGGARSLHDALLSATLGGPNWNGPYVSALVPDPWGGAYLVNAEGWLDVRQSAWILSAGPDGIVQTPPEARAPHGDDLLWLLD